MRNLWATIVQAVVILICFIVFIAWISDDANAEWIKVIGCIHSKTLETREPKKGACYYGKGWQNIALPPESQMKVWKKVFSNDQMIINRLPIVNFESSFNEFAWNKYAVWYVQTLRSYKIAPDAESQLIWMKNRQDSQKKWNCSQHKTESRLMRCLYARHYGALTSNHWYPNKAMVARDFYISYFKKNGFNF